MRVKESIETEQILQSGDELKNISHLCYKEEEEEIIHKEGLRSTFFFHTGGCTNVLQQHWPQKEV